MPQKVNNHRIVANTKNRPLSSQLPRATQQRILANVEDALTAYEVRKGR